jgi:hypothetical protein
MSEDDCRGEAAAVGGEEEVADERKRKAKLDCVTAVRVPAWLWL